ncbi:LytTR family transcriptional regulator [Luteimonas sp. XNQY3]|nr:LytTR family DNA-binding domain-containing protein [Luteimonas sp. XNQY3]MCD9007081.1 LytTR family transcriptional regulator [Luteimonas sp. XNQY3]
MSNPAPTAYQRFLPWKRWFEIGLWLALIGVNAIGNSITHIMEFRRGGSTVQDWEPVVWEISSAMVWLLVVIPGLVWFTRRFPFHWDKWRSQIGLHLLASVVVSLVHVGGMVGLRMLAYRWHGGEYTFGPWPRELLYEYVKDVRAYAMIVLAIEVYRLLLRRLQGEVQLLAAPDEGPPLERIERPERFLVRKLGRDFLVATSDIEWAQASGNYVNLHVRGHDYPLRSTMAGIESKLDPERFVRIHRSYLVNLDQVASIEPLDSGDASIHLKDGALLPCSRSYRTTLRAGLGEYPNTQGG